MAEPWYAKPWRRTGAGRRAVVGACGYLVAGAGGLVLAAVANGMMQRVIWAAFGVVFISLGSTLAATLAHRRR